MGEWITAVPSLQQFGILGLQMQGYYTITAIPYSGSGEVFALRLCMAASV
jgi:hypothetical protein